MFANTGFVAGTAAAICTQPLDLVKTRLMTQGLRPSGLQMYRGVWDTMRTVVQEEGVAGLSRGLGTRLLFTSSFNAIGFPVFEGAKGQLVRRESILRSRCVVCASFSVSFWRVCVSVLSVECNDIDRRVLCVTDFFGGSLHHPDPAQGIQGTEQRGGEGWEAGGRARCREGETQG